MNVPYDRCVQDIVSASYPLCFLSQCRALILTTTQHEGTGIASAVSIALGDDLDPAPEDGFDFELKWSINAHSALPHLSEEDVYEGYRIPKGSYVQVSCMSLRVQLIRTCPSGTREHMGDV